jgi:hypothetical protein
VPSISNYCSTYYAVIAGSLLDIMMTVMESHANRARTGAEKDMHD